MGGCATKPKVLKGDERDVPAPAPPTEPTKEPVPAVAEAKDVADVVAAEEGEKKVEADAVGEVVKAKEVVVVDDDKVDDQANKRQSLTNLFEESEKKGAAETDSDNPPSEPTKNESPAEGAEIKSVEPVKQELLSEPEKQAPSDTEKLKEENETRNQETKESEKPIEQTNEAETSSAASGKIESAKSVETEAVPEATATATVNVAETQNKETSATDNEEGKTEVAK